jgi:hypothetical protein
VEEEALFLFGQALLQYLTIAHNPSEVREGF